MTDGSAAPPPPPRPDNRSDGGSPGVPSITMQGHVVTQIETEMGADPGHEVGGILLGKAAPSSNFVLVTASLAARQDLRPPTIDASSGEAGDVERVPAGTFLLTETMVKALTREVAASYPGERIVGWYHSRPGAGVFLSPHDRSIQSAFFKRAWQVLYIYDPAQSERGFFGWSSQEIRRIPTWEVASTVHGPRADLAVDAPVADPKAVDWSLVTGELSGLLASEPEPDADNDTGEQFGSSEPADRSPRSVDGAQRSRKSVGIILGVVAAIVAIIILAVMNGSGDDDDPSATLSSAVGTSQPDPESSNAGSIETDGSAAASTDVTTDVTTESDAVVPQPTATSSAQNAAVTTEPAAIAFPATPTVVQPPSSRIGGSPCKSGADGQYQPINDCFVAMDNGNVLAFVSGSLRCADPAGQVVAAEAQRFSVGVENDPIVLTADDALIPTCTNLDYAKNVLAGGSDTLDGLCGSSGTQLNDATRRCISSNLASGAMVAIVRGADDPALLVASCVAEGAGDPELSPLTWSSGDVGANWRIVSVVYQARDNQFVATATRGSATATAPTSCG